MTLLEAISERKSRRLFLPIPIDSLIWQHLLSISEEYNNVSGLRIQLLENGSKAFSSFRKTYGLFSGVRSLIILAGNTDDPDLLEKSGYYGELLVLEATRLGLGTCWVGGSFDQQAIRELLPDNQTLVAVITIGNVEELSLKEKLVHQLVAGKSKTTEQLLENHSDSPPWVLEAMKKVQKAPSAGNQQPVLFHYNNQNIRASVPEIKRFTLIDLGIAKLHFALAANGTFEWGNNGIFHKH